MKLHFNIKLGTELIIAKNIDIYIYIIYIII